MGNNDLGGMPDTTGRKEGDTWTGKNDQGQTVIYTIPKGNGNQTVDQTVTTPDGTVLAQSRVVSNGAGGWQRWTDVTGGTAVYTGQDTGQSNAYAQLYNPGTSTKGAPDSVYGLSPDLKQNFPLVENGQVVGQLQTKDHGGGLVDNYYINKDGVLTQWRSNPTENGGMVTNQKSEVDSTGHGWYAAGGMPGGGGLLWDVSPSLDGGQFWTNTEKTNSGTHFRTYNPQTNASTDKYIGDKPNTGYYLEHREDGTTVRRGDDGSYILLDKSGKVLEQRGPRPEEEKPDTRSKWQKFLDGADNFGDGIGESAAGLYHGIKALAGQEGSAKEAWLGLGLGFATVGTGVTMLGIDAVEYARGAPGVDANTFKDDALGTLNATSELLIGTDWTGFSEHPAETLGNATFGGLTLLGPKGLGKLGGKLPPGLPETAVNGVSSLADWAQQYVPAPGKYAFPGGLGDGLAIKPDIFGIDNGRGSPRPGGDGLADAPGRDRGGSGPDGSSPDGAPIRPGGPNLPLVPEGMLDPKDPSTDVLPSEMPDNHARAGDPSGEHGSPAVPEPYTGPSWLAPEGVIPEGIRVGENGGWYQSGPNGGQVRKPEWAKKNPSGEKPLPPGPEQRALEKATEPSRDGMVPMDPKDSWDVSPPGFTNTAGVRGFVGDALTRAKYLAQGYRLVAAGEKAKIPIPGKPGEFFKPDFIFVHPKTGEILLVESKFNSSPYRPDQFEGYRYYKDGGKYLEIDSAKNPDLAQALRDLEINPAEATVSGVETVRWNEGWGPTDDILQRAADDTGFGNLVDGTATDPKWRDSALGATAALNAEAARRAFESGRYVDAAYYEARSLALEGLRLVEPSQQALQQALFGNGGRPQAENIAGALALPVDNLTGVVEAGANALSSLAAALPMLPTAAVHPVFRRGGQQVDQSMTVTIATRIGDGNRLSRAEESQLMTHGAHLC